MPTPASTLLADVLRRIRDPNATMVATDNPPSTATGNTFVYSMLTVAQIYVNLAERLIVNTMQQYLDANSAIYDMTIAAADYGGKIVACNTQGGNEIDGPVDWHALGRASRTWLTDVAAAGLTGPLAWAPFGKTLLALVPVFNAGSLPIIVNILYLQAPGTLGPFTNLAVPDFAAEHVARVAELLCRLKTRQLTDFETRVKDLANELQLHDAMQDTGRKAG